MTTAIVTIDSKQWNVTVAQTPLELTSGLSNVVSIPSWSGMLFDMGVDRSSIPVNMGQMLFALDIVFMNSTQGVVGVLHDVQPGDEAQFQADTTAGARYFLEMNAGEAEDIAVGDTVDLGGGEERPLINTLATVMATSVVLTGLISGILASGAFEKKKEGKK